MSLSKIRSIEKERLQKVQNILNSKLPNHIKIKAIQQCLTSSDCWVSAQINNIFPK